MLWELSIDDSVFARLQPGYSGGPVIDGQGRVVGVATHREADTRGYAFCISNLWLLTASDGRAIEDLLPRRSLRAGESRIQVNTLKPASGAATANSAVGKSILRPHSSSASASHELAAEPQPVVSSPAQAQGDTLVPASARTPSAARRERSRPDHPDALQLRSNPSMQINWLHLTDLHRGMKKQDWLWQNVRERLLEDLDYLHPKSGPWDLLLFTGDLTDRGTKAQFGQADALLIELMDWISERQGGHRPALLAVPGNHDLERPKDHNEGLRYLKGWANTPDTRETFWDNPSSAVRRTVSKAFAQYDAWWGRQAVPLGEAAGVRDYSRGLLPGDFSAVVQRDGCSVGILGINISVARTWTSAPSWRPGSIRTWRRPSADGNGGIPSPSSAGGLAGASTPSPSGSSRPI